MKKHSLKNLIALLVALVFAVTLVSAPVAAYEAAPEDVIIISVSNSDTEVEGLMITEKAFHFFGLPDTDYDMMILQVRDSSGTVAHQYQVDKDAEADACVDFPMLDFPSGSYDLALWSGISANGEWHWDHLVSIAVRRTAQGWKLHDERAYKQNQSLAEQERVDETARAWYVHSTPDDPRIVVLALTITEGCETAYAKALAIHDWICENFYYDYDYLKGLRPGIDVSAVGVLDAGMTICAGYAALFTELCRAAGVAAKTVTGYAKSPSLSAAYPDGVFTDERTGNHAWNEFLSDDERWVVVDCTWDCGNSVENGVKTKRAGCEHQYFDPGAGWLALSHATVNVCDIRELTFYINHEKMYDRDNGTWHDYSDDGAVPYLLDGHTMVPLYSIVRFLDGSLKWDEETVYPGWTAINCQILGHSVWVFLGWNKFFVDGAVFDFTNVPELVDGHVRVELHPLLTAIGCEVHWDGRKEWEPGAVSVTCEVLLRP